CSLSLLRWFVASTPNLCGRERWPCCQVLGEWPPCLAPPLVGCSPRWATGAPHSGALRSRPCCSPSWPPGPCHGTKLCCGPPEATTCLGLSWSCFWLRSSRCPGEASPAVSCRP